MKKNWLFSICLLLIVIISYPVKAMEYKIEQIIPAGEVATVKTERFTYNDFVYQSQIDTSGNGLMTFSSIKNNMITTSSVSINVLLFDEKQENIGFLTYCSDKDISSDYAEFKLAGGAESPFSIKVVRKYFGEGKSSADVKYIAVLDDNKYCHIGGYTKYLGKNLGEIIKAEHGEITKKSTHNSFINKYLQDTKMLEYVYPIVGTVVALFIVGAVLSSLSEKMYGKSSLLAFIPIANGYIATKLAFGNIVSLIYIIIYILSAILFYFKVSFLFIICTILFAFAFIVDIIKLITKNYDLLFLDPSMDVKGFGDKTFDDEVVNSFMSAGDISKSGEDEINVSEGAKTENSNMVDNSDAIDLNYTNSGIKNEGINDLNNNGNSDILGELDAGTINFNSQKDDSEEDEESDLSKYFH